MGFLNWFKKKNKKERKVLNNNEINNEEVNDTLNFFRNKKKNKSKSQSQPLNKKDLKNSNNKVNKKKNDERDENIQNLSEFDSKLIYLDESEYDKDFVEEKRLREIRENLLFDNSYSKTSFKNNRKEIKPHIHKNNIIKNQLINRIKLNKINESTKNNFQEKIVPPKREKPVKLTNKKKIDKSARLINKGVIYDPRDLTIEFNKLGRNQEDINKVVSNRIKKTINKLRRNKFSLTKKDRLMLYTDLNIIKMATERGFRLDNLRIDKRLTGTLAYDNSITLSESLHEIAWFLGQKNKFKMIDKIEGVVLDRDVEEFVLLNLNNPLNQVKKVSDMVDLKVNSSEMEM